MSKKVWILADDRMGNLNQLRGIAEALNWPTEEKEIRYNKWIRLPNFLRRSSLIGIDSKSQMQLHEPWPDVVLSAGRRSFPAALYIKKKSQGKTKVVQIMNPGMSGFKKADIVVLPEHDSFHDNRALNVMRVVGSPHRVTVDRLKQEKEKWRTVFEKYPSLRLSLIVGGATKDKPFTVQMAEELVKQVLALKPRSVLVTTSRRTPHEVVKILLQRLPHDKMFFYQFGDLGENPYFGLLAWADMIVVTGDSISMCSECCASGVPVYIFAPDEMMSEKHKRFHQSLYNGGYAVPLGSGIKGEVQGYFNPAIEIAEKIKSLFKKK